jgi:hypothetical protein
MNISARHNGAEKASGARISFFLEEKNAFFSLFSFNLVARSLSEPLA